MRRYTVYDNRTDLPVAVEETAKNCAEAMGVNLDTFYHAINQTRGKRWTVLKCEPTVIPRQPRQGRNPPSMLRLSQIAEILGTTVYHVKKLCEERGISMTKAGRGRKITMISRDEFFTKTQEEK